MRARDPSDDGDEVPIRLLAPLGRDAGLLRDALAGHGYAVHVVDGAGALAETLERAPDAGVLVLTQEALTARAMRAVEDHLDAQPPWEELPIVLLVDGAGHTARELVRFQDALPRARVLVLRRPIRLSELGSAVETMRQSRLRQRALRDYVERQERLRRELNHRVKNVLASVQALHALTAAGADDLDAFNDRFEGRLEAMAGVHRVLHDDDYGASELAAVAEAILAPYRDADGAGVEIDGEPVPLGAEVAQGLALVLHELAANASAHGALSRPGGRVRLSWGVSEERFEARWVERDGPDRGRSARHGPGTAGAAATAGPRGSGYGTRFMEATMRGYGGTATFDYAPGGARVTLAAPAANVLADPSREGASRGSVP